MELLIALCYITLILISICCLIYINKSATGAIKSMIEMMLKDTDEE